MSGAADALILAALGNIAALAPVGGVAIAGAGLYFAGRKMHADYHEAMREYQARLDRECQQNWAQTAAFQAAQSKANQMALELSQQALEDPNTLFILSGISRLQHRLGQGGPSGGAPAAAMAEAEAMAAECAQLAQMVATGGMDGSYGRYEKLARRVSAWSVKSAAAIIHSGATQHLVIQARTALEEFHHDLGTAMDLGEAHAKALKGLQARALELEALAQAEPAVVLQGLDLLEERLRGELRQLGQKEKAKSELATKMRQLVGTISARAQAVLAQELLPESRERAQALLKQLAVQVAQTPVLLESLETLAREAEELFVQTEEAISEMAVQEHLQDQVSQVLGSLGYRVTMASSGEEEANLVAVLDSELGLQIKVDGKGQLSSEMVAFSEASSVVDDVAQERVCQLMDEIYAGLRRRNLKVQEKKRRNLKVGRDKVKVVQAKARDQAAPQAATSQKLLEISLPK